MDTRIALAGQPIDFAGSMSNGLAAGQQAVQAQRQNALAQLYQTQGPGIMAGDPGALNALAQMDPTAALGIQGSQLGMQAQRQQMAFSAENMQMARDKAKADAAAHAAQMTAEQRAAEAAKLNTVLKGAAAAYATGNEAQYNAFLQSHGVNPAEYPFAQFPMIAAMGDGVLETLTTLTPKPADPLKGAPAGMMWNDPANPAAGVTPIPGMQAGPDWRAATPDEAKMYGAAGGQINGKTGEFKPINPPSGGITITNPDGTTTQIGGPAGGSAKLTEDQGKSTGFFIRMRDSNAILNSLDVQGLDYMAGLKAKDPTGLMNYTQTPQYQQYEQAKRDFINALLRRESGAAISPSEFANAEQQYFPQPGNPPEVVDQKRRNRENAIKGLEVSSGPGVSNPLVTGTDTVDGTQSKPMQIGPAGEGFDKVKPGQFYITPDGNVYQKG